MLSPSLQAVVRAARPPFLLLTPACVALGAASAIYAGFEIALTDVIAAVIGGLSAHVSVNTFNEYFDYNSGLDTLTQRTPFSGGSGALLTTPGALNYVLSCAWASMALAFMVGIYFLIKAGPAIIPIGLTGAAIIYAYTNWINKNPWACLLAPGVGFGPLMVMGTQAALTGQLSLVSMVLSLVPLCLVSNLLLVNQLPDIEPDRQVGRRHLAIVFGVASAVNAYVILMLAAMMSLLLAIVLGMAPVLSVLAMIPMSLGWLVYRALTEFGNGKALPLQAMAINVLVAVSTPALLAITLLL